MCVACATVDEKRAHRGGWVLCQAQVQNWHLGVGALLGSMRFDILIPWHVHKALHNNYAGNFERLPCGPPAQPYHFQQSEVQRQIHQTLSMILESNLDLTNDLGG